MDTKPYSVRVFNSATGHTFFQVMGPFGKVYESTERDKAEAECSRRNERANND